MQESDGDQQDRDSGRGRDKTAIGDRDRRRACRPTILLGFSGEQSWKLRLPERGRIILGRGEGSDHLLSDARVSRNHCRVHVSTTVLLEDLGSANGTWLMGKPLCRGEKSMLKSGDVFELGDTSVICQVSAPSSFQAEELEARGSGIRGAPRPGEVGVAMEALRRMTERIARSRINVLICGETGVGKGVLAAELHRKSARGRHPFVSLNCAELQETLLESELFGHERGAFTGANSSKPGLIETADGGTLFLDEIGEMSLSTQAKLLRVLEERSVRRVGSLQARPVDVRLLAASNRDLDAESERGTFRRDLYFRLNGISLMVPPLRERLDELEPLARTFIAQASEALGRDTPTLSAKALEALRRHTWPGNIRELRNVVERAVILCPGDVLTSEHVPLSPQERASKVVTLAAHGPAARGETRSLDRAPLPEKQLLERRRIEEALELCAGNQSRAAKLLGISRATLVGRLNLYGFPRPRKQTG
jgi:two-component system response regulator AtoC